MTMFFERKEKFFQKLLVKSSKFVWRKKTNPSTIIPAFFLRIVRIILR